MVGSSKNVSKERIKEIKEIAKKAVNFPVLTKEEILNNYDKANTNGMICKVWEDEDGFDYVQTSKCFTPEISRKMGLESAAPFRITFPEAINKEYIESLITISEKVALVFPNMTKEKIADFLDKYGVKNHMMGLHGINIIWDKTDLPADTKSELDLDTVDGFAHKFAGNIFILVGVILKNDTDFILQDTTEKKFWNIVIHECCHICKRSEFLCGDGAFYPVDLNEEEVFCHMYSFAWSEKHLDKMDTKIFEINPLFTKAPRMDRE